PPLNTTTYLLWLGPFVLLIGGVAGLFLMLRRRQNVQVDTTLSEEEVRRVEAILASDKES
ncbi:MAG TPA: cytochrome c-type biogenesis protein CcmH, partial [Methylotenera sp.]|nr:cytochrome c-type biogenesis protein CcmH [Methylotenera sp.]